MFAKNPNQMLALRHQKMDTAERKPKWKEEQKGNAKEAGKNHSLSTKPKTQKKKKKHKMKAPDQPNQKIKMPGPEFSCRSKNAASYVQALFQKKNPTQQTQHTTRT